MLCKLLILMDCSDLVAHHCILLDTKSVEWGARDSEFESRRPDQRTQGLVG